MRNADNASAAVRAQARALRWLVVALAVCIAWPLGALAGELAAPAGKVILTIDGKISRTTNGREALFDRAALEALGLQALTTSNPFEKGAQHYEGVLLSKVLTLVGATGSKLAARALDGYTVEIPVKDAFDYPVLLAMKWNGKIMRVRNKGPLWIVYPVDQYQELNHQDISGRSIWQLQRLTVK